MKLESRYLIFAALLEMLGIMGLVVLTKVIKLAYGGEPPSMLLQAGLLYLLPLSTVVAGGYCIYTRREYLVSLIIWGFLALAVAIGIICSMLTRHSVPSM